MKRWTLRISLWLLLGVATTVGVAWGGALVSPQFQFLYQMIYRYASWEMRADRTAMSVQVVSSGNYDPDAASRAAKLLQRLPGNEHDEVDILDRVPFEERAAQLPSWGAFTRVTRSTMPTGNWSERGECYGWPLPAMWNFHRRMNGVTDVVGITIQRARSSAMRITDDEVRIERTRSGQRGSLLLPTRVYWPGFLIDTLCYAAAWCVLLVGLRAGVMMTRRTIRKRRGQCMNCGYDLRGDRAGGCPECGWNREP